MKNGIVDEFPPLGENEKVGVLVKDRIKRGRGVFVKKGDVCQKNTPKTLTPLEKFVRSILRKSKIETLPSLDSLISGMEGQKMKVSDIGIFIEEPSDSDLLSTISKSFKTRNRINLSTNVSIKQVKSVAVDLLTAGRMYMPIGVAKVQEEGQPETIECWTGRHRLAFIALAYGVDVEVPVHITKYSIADAMNAVRFANKTRKTLPLEKAEYRVLGAVGGNASTDRGSMYASFVRKKSSVADFCAFSVLDQKLDGMLLNFPVVKDVSRQAENGITTVGNLIGFWKKSVGWVPGMTVEEFDAALSKNVNFLNVLVDEMKKLKEFKPSQHLATMPLVAIGTFYSFVEDGGANPVDGARLVAQAIVGMGDIGRQKSNTIYSMLSKVLRK